MSVVPKYAGKKLYEDISRIADQQWDTIVIGSGIGGMSCAAALAKCKQKVLVLERHYLPGGFTHSFARKGYQWDAGVHAIGEMGEREVPGKILRWLSNNKINMLSLGDPYDEFIFPKGFRYSLPNSCKAYRENLIKEFPEYEKEIDTYLKHIRYITQYSKFFFVLKTMPEWLDQKITKMLHKFSRNWWAMTTQEVFDELELPEKLQTLLSVHWGYYGSVPRDSSFVIHALTHTHFWNGAYYPDGGSKVFAETFLGNVIENKGAVATNAEVASLIIEKGKVLGVELKNGRKIYANNVVSAAGAKTTVNRLLPTSLKESSWGKQIAAVADSPPYICLNLGFKGDIRAAGAKASNQWLFNTWDNNVTYWDISNPDELPHILYLSFPSLKDPQHKEGKSQKHTGECVTFLTYDHFTKWEGTSHQDRQEDYKALKESIAERILEQLRTHFPQIMQHLDYYELSTPLTTIDYTQASKGAIYGLAATPQRFTNKALRARTPLRNFYMSGVDIASLGVVGGMVSGVLTAATMKKQLYLKLL